MRPVVALSLLLLLLLAVAAPASSRRRRERPAVTCPGIDARAACDGSNGGLRLFDGCNTCRCSSRPQQPVCSLARCPAVAEILDARQRRRAERYCGRLLRRMQLRQSRFRERQSGGGGGGGGRGGRRRGGRGRGRRVKDWPMKCFNDRRLCARKPVATYFDGCNNCRCQEGRGVCETTNTCETFRGTRRQFRQHCRDRGARILTRRREESLFQRRLQF